MGVRCGEGRCVGEIWEGGVVRGGVLEIWEGGVVRGGEGRCAGEIWEGRGGGVGLVGVISPALFLCCGCL